MSTQAENYLRGLTKEKTIPAVKQGVMIALPIPLEVAQNIRNPSVPPEEMHVTLAYLGRAENVSPEDIRRCVNIVKEVCAMWPQQQGSIGGIGRFFASESSDGKDVIYGAFNMLDLPEIRQEIVYRMRADGVNFKNNHGFTPHMTVAYVDKGEPVDAASYNFPDQPFPIMGICIHVGDHAIEIPFTAEPIENTAPELEYDVIPQISDEDAMALSMLGIKMTLKEAVEEVPHQHVSIVGTDAPRRLVYGVVIEPNSMDVDGDVMTPEQVEYAAHHFMSVRGIMAYRHKKAVKAVPVESYVAPVDFEMGGQKVIKGSWVMVSRCDDPKTWDEIATGFIKGYSVGGFSSRRPLA